MILNVITLPQRKEQAIKEINRLGIEAIYWDAIVYPDNTIKAISHSHKQIVQYALNNNLNEAAIAEDDILFTSLNSYKYFLENKPNYFDIYLGGYYSGVRNKDNTIFGFSGLHLYIISNRFFKTFLSLPETRNIDGLLAGLGKYVVCHPQVAKQRNGYSFHRKKIVNDDHYIKEYKFLLD